MSSGPCRASICNLALMPERLTRQGLVMSTFRLTRRSLLAMSVVPALPIFSKPVGDHHFAHDHILGTSLDLTISGVSAAEAQAAEQAALQEVERLRKILSTYDPSSEISRLGLRSPGRSADLDNVLDAYRHWSARTGGVLQPEIAGVINIDALGKAYI